MKFCPQCGQRLIGLPLEEKQRSIPKPEAYLTESSTIPKPESPPKESNWFERHLNWTMVLAWVGTYPISFIVGGLAILTDPYISDDILSGIGFTIGLIVSIAVGQWVLRKKNRSMWWLLISPTIFFLLIGNKSPTKSQEVSNRIRT